MAAARPRARLVAPASALASVVLTLVLLSSLRFFTVPYEVDKTTLSVIRSSYSKLGHYHQPSTNVGTYQYHHWLVPKMARAHAQTSTNVGT